MAANAILLVHAAFVLFVVASLPAIWLGAALGWGWVRNRWFRGLHLAAIAFVVIETVLGFVCPLTIWEDALRGTSDERGFIARWVHSWLFYQWPPWVFNAIYIAFGLAVALTWFLLPPRKRERAPSA